MARSIYMIFLPLLLCALPHLALAQGALTDRFEGQPENRWRFFTDGVMGGVSQGELRFVRQDGAPYARLSGSVSTANNGGFIQMRRDFDTPPGGGVEGVRLIVRGNAERYFVHLRTRGTVLPWQYYQAGFTATPEWREVRLPLNAFERSGRLLRPTPAGSSLTSYAVVAFGRDHRARVEVREIGFY